MPRPGPVPPPHRARPATIVDVARRAGVSTATVSRALAAPGQVAEKTRAAVIAAIAATGYTPNASARSLRARNTRMVLALMPGMSNSFFTPILNTIEDVLSEAGYGMIIGDTRNSPAKEAHYVRLIRAGQVDGVILFTGHLPRDGERVIDDSQIPVVLVCNEIPGVSSVPVFDVANREAARVAVDHLLGLGHRRIAHIGGPPANSESRERLKGYVDAITAAGIEVDDDIIWQGNFRFDSGVANAERFLALRDRPTAVFAATDDTAIGFVKSVRDAGLHVPRDVSVVGFDDIEYATVFDPPLTTMRQPRAELGRLAAEYLLRRMTDAEPGLTPLHIRLGCELVVRNSALPAAKDKGLRRERPRAVS